MSTEISFKEKTIKQVSNYVFFRESMKVYANKNRLLRTTDKTNKAPLIHIVCLRSCTYTT